MTTRYDTQAMEEGPGQLVTTTAVPWPTNHGHTELQTLSASLQVPAAAEPISSNTHAYLEDPEEVDEVSPGVKLTGYRLLNIVVIFTIGTAKYMLSLKGQSIAPTGLEWAGGLVLAVLLYWIGLYEAVKLPRWGWFFHVDWAPGIGFASKGFLGGVLWWLVGPAKYYPSYLAIYLCLTRLSHLAFVPDTMIWRIVRGFLSACLSFLLLEELPMKWRAWQHIPGWAPVKRFFQECLLGSFAGSQHRLIENVGFWLGFLLGYGLWGLFGILVMLLLSNPY